MKRSFLGLLIVGSLLTAIATNASGDDAKDEAIKKDRKQIEGTWRCVSLVYYGIKSTDDEAKAITVVNGADGTWSARDDGKEFMRGTSTFDPTKTPKTIDFTPIMGELKGEKYLGIYELGENTRRICFAPPGQKRPTEFSSKLGSEQILITFEREKAK